MQNSRFLFLLSKVPVMTQQPFYITTLSNVVANQLIHTQYGGVVPELASCIKQNIPVIDASPKQTLVKNNCQQ
jgi:tRNA A37 threonylcarbamoyltransferase TsaD